MKIAIPVENGRLNAHFGGSKHFALVEVDPKTKATLSSEVVSAPEHQPGLFPLWLREQGVQLLIAGGIGQRALTLFAQHGIPVRAGFPDAPIEQLVAACLSGQLTATPEGCEHHGHHHHEHHQQHQRQRQHQHDRDADEPG
jgi:predicted Fe-Mo cluster-binding NifX family protein